MSSNSSNSCEVNDLEKEKAQLLKEIEDFVSEINTKGFESLDEAEGLVSEKVNLWKQKLLEINKKINASQQK